MSDPTPKASCCKAFGSAVVNDKIVMGEEGWIEWLDRGFGVYRVILVCPFCQDTAPGRLISKKVRLTEHNQLDAKGITPVDRAPISGWDVGREINGKMEARFWSDEGEPALDA